MAWRNLRATTVCAAPAPEAGTTIEPDKLGIAVILGVLISAAAEQLDIDQPIQRGLQTERSRFPDFRKVILTAT
jgi:hypothetical protein